MLVVEALELGLEEVLDAHVCGRAYEASSTGRDRTVSSSEQASTIAGSNYEPEQRTSSLSASLGDSDRS